MLPYFILVILPFAVYVLGLVKGKKWDKKCLTLFFIIFIVLLSLRSIDCGVDLKNYNYIFNNLSTKSISNIFNLYNREFLFYALNKIVYVLFSDFRVMIIISALISIIPILIVYKNESKNMLLTLSLFLTIAPFSVFFSGLRQSLAIGIVFLSYPFLKKKKCIPFIITVLIASLFHKSSLVCLIIYPIYHFKHTKKIFYFFVPLLIITWIFKNQLFSTIIQFVDPLYQERYNIIESTGAYGMLILLLMLDLFCFILPEKGQIDGDFNGLRNILVLSTFIQCFASINPIVMRINYYLLLFVPLLIPMVKYKCKKENIKITNLFELFLTSFLIFYFFYNGYNGNDILQIFPYIPFWR